MNYTNNSESALEIENLKSLLIESETKVQSLERQIAQILANGGPAQMHERLVKDMLALDPSYFESCAMADEFKAITDKML